MSDAELTPQERRTLERGTRHLDTGETIVSRPLRVKFPAANTARDIAHGLGVIPDGYRIVWTNAEIHATPGTLWTPTLAYLQANAANALAIVRFYVLKDRPVDA